MAYEAYCAACTYMGEVVDCGKYWCSSKGEDRYACDPKCYSFCEAYSRSNSARENMYNNSKNAGSSCYLTTIMCELLGYEDDNYYLNTLRSFRDNVMKKDKNYIPLLMIYDVVGPMIAKKLSEDNYGKEIASVFFEKYISKAVQAIEEGKNNEAINIYKAMTDTLAEKYGVNVTLVNPDTKEIDMKYLGHARTKKYKLCY